MNESNEVAITYETLFELLRREKDREELQKLEQKFFEEVVNYLKDKQQILSNNQDTSFSFEDKKKIEMQIENIKKMIRDLYARREKKIVNMAIDKSRTKSGIIETSALLNEERGLFEQLVGLLDTCRENMLFRILNLQNPQLAQFAFFKNTLDNHNQSTQETIPLTNQTQQPQTEEAAPPKETQSTRPNQEQHVKLVRFLHAIPKFVGKELEEYGPFVEEDMANLPSEIADVLINKGRVEEIGN